MSRSSLSTTVHLVFEARSADAHSPALDAFFLRCWARACLIKNGKMPLQEGVDGLQASAVSTGLVDRLGQDAIQMIMAQALKPREAER